MSVSRFAQPVRDGDELQVRAGALPENTKATTDWGIAFGVNGLPVELLLSAMELLQLRHPCWRYPRQT